MDVVMAQGVIVVTPTTAPVGCSSSVVVGGWLMEPTRTIMTKEDTLRYFLQIQ